MALWYETGNGQYQVSFARRENSCVAFLCGGGPSLNEIDAKKLNGHNRIVFGLNNTYPRIRPDVWIGMDDPRCYWRDIFYQPFPKIMRGGYQNRVAEFGKVDHLYNIFYADVKKPKYPEDIFKLRKHDIKFVWKWSTLITALHIVIWMGCKKIYLFGNDLSVSEKDYFDSTELDAANRKHNIEFYSQMCTYLKWFSEEAKKYDIEVYSCSSTSKANAFLNYVNYEDVIRGCEATLPKTEELFHTNEAENTWSKKR